MQYKEYLKTKHWRDFRSYVYSRYKCCSVCGARDSLNIHHLTYDTLWNEQLSDVLVLCTGCHHNYHDGIIGHDVIDFVIKRVRPQTNQIKKKRHKQVRKKIKVKRVPSERELMRKYGTVKFFKMKREGKL